MDYEFTIEQDLSAITVYGKEEYKGYSYSAPRWENFIPEDQAEIMWMELMDEESWEWTKYAEKLG